MSGISAFSSSQDEISDNVNMSDSQLNADNNGSLPEEVKVKKGFFGSIKSMASKYSVILSVIAVIVVLIIIYYFINKSSEPDNFTKSTGSDNNNSDIRKLADSINEYFD
jgi:uncharacterized membrane protein YvbJ